MPSTKPILRALLAASLLGLATADSFAQCPSATGPDVIVGQVGNPGGGSTEGDGVYDTTPVGGIDAFAVGTYSCNIGDTWLNWIAGSNQHPVIPQNMYRLKDGRIEQIGMSWMKHGFFALSNVLCCPSCQNTDGTHLGIGCSDPYTPGRNGSQLSNSGGLGPRFQVNPHTGAFVWPYMFRNTSTGIGNTSISRRLQVALTDLDPALNAGAVYFVEAQYVTPDDAAYGNQDNNSSHRLATISGAAGATNFSAGATGPTYQGEPAITAWKRLDNSVVETPFDTSEVMGNAPAFDTTGRAYISAKATDLGGGMWHYEYAIFNLNSDRAFDGVSIPVSDSFNVSNIGFHDVSYHSGDGYNSTTSTPVTFDGTDWPGIASSGAVAWNMVPASPVQNSNALRWATMYNYRFDCNSPPTSGVATLSYFKDVVGLPGSVDVATIVPTPVVDCPANIAGGDSIVDVSDLLAVITAWGACPDPCPPACNADIAPNCVVDVNDLLAVITSWGPCK